MAKFSKKQQIFGINRFSKTDSLQHIIPKCDTPESREAAYKMLITLSKNCRTNAEIIGNISMTK